MKFLVKPFVVMSALTGLLLASGHAAVPQAIGKKPPLNIGFAVYTKGVVPGTLNGEGRKGSGLTLHPQAV